MKTLVTIVFLALVSRSMADPPATNTPSRKAAVIVAAVVTNLKWEAYHDDTDLGPLFVRDISKLAILAPPRYAGKALELHHEHLAGFCQTNVPICFTLKTQVLDSTNDCIRIAEEDLIGRTRRLDRDRPPRR